MASATKTPKGAPFSIRLSKPTELYVENEARRTRRSKSAIVEDLTEEAARVRRFPGISFRTGGDGSREAHLDGTGFYVWMFVDAIKNLRHVSLDEFLEAYSDLTKHHVDLAFAYYKQYPAEIDEAIAENNRPIEELLLINPLIKVAYVDLETDAAPPA